MTDKHLCESLRWFSQPATIRAAELIESQAAELERLRALVAPARAAAESLRYLGGTLHAQRLEEALAAAPAQRAEPPCPYYITGPDIAKGAYAVAEVATGRIVARIPAEQAPSLTVGAGPVARVVRREIAAGHDTPASHTFDVEWLTVDPFKWQGDLYAAPQPAAQGVASAARAVLANYDRARAEKYDECAWAELRDQPFEDLRAALAQAQKEQP